MAGIIVITLFKGVTMKKSFMVLVIFAMLFISVGCVKEPKPINYNDPNAAVGRNYSKNYLYCQKLLKTCKKDRIMATYNFNDSYSWSCTCLPEGISALSK